MVMLKNGQVSGAGKPAKVMTAETVRTVFGIASVMVPDLVKGTSMCVPFHVAEKHGVYRPAFSGGAASL